MATNDITVPTDKRPTFFNRDAAVGFVVGSFIPLVGNIGGAIVGGLLGMARMKYDASYGKTVHPPTFWNKTLVIGAGLGLYAGIAAAGVILLLSSSGPAVIAAGLSFLAGPIIGGMIGGGLGNGRMTREYSAAQAYVESQEAASEQSVSPQTGRSNAYQVSPEEAAQLESRLSESRSANFADKVKTQQAMQLEAAR